VYAGRERGIPHGEQTLDGHPDIQRSLGTVTMSEAGCVVGVVIATSLRPVTQRMSPDLGGLGEGVL
jgi:hypothetical protein